MIRIIIYLINMLFNKIVYILYDTFPKSFVIYANIQDLNMIQQKNLNFKNNHLFWNKSFLNMF